MGERIPLLNFNEVNEVHSMNSNLKTFESNLTHFFKEMKNDNRVPRRWNPPYKILKKFQEEDASQTNQIFGANALFPYSINRSLASRST